MSIFYTVLVVWVIGWVMMVKRNLTMDSPWFSAVFLFLVWPVALVKEMVEYTGVSKELAELRKEMRQSQGSVADQQLGQPPPAAPPPPPPLGCFLLVFFFFFPPVGLLAFTLTPIVLCFV